ncbi:MAG: hypothetical protein JSS66_11610 [Armatimonadetes bacterium]|nr:hypothetical protein [Armatimonadota bacterium]
MPFVALNALALLLAAGLPTDSLTRDELVELVNSYRAEHGLEQLVFNDTLGRAASSHANFMALNNVLSHFEKEGMPGFTGANLSDRARQVGWDDECSELVGYASTTVRDSFQAIFDSPCHRVRFLKPGTLQLGVAAQDTFVCIMVGGQAGPGSVVSPPDHASGVPTSWYGAPDFSGTRTRGGKLFGYPMTFTAPAKGDAVMTNVAAELTDQDGKTVPIIVRDSHNDTHYDCSAAIVPESPLQPSATYTVHVSAIAPGGAKIDKSWSFTTAEKKQDRQ